jgi:predicted dehydrogenase
LPSGWSQDQFNLAPARVDDGRDLDLLDLYSIQGVSVEPLRVAVVGAGYWGPNLIRNFSASQHTELRKVCDLDVERARKVVGQYSTVDVTASYEEVLADPEIEAVAIATPARTHLEVALAALEAGKHVMVEKPLASSVAEGRKLVDAAAEHKRVLMCDHTYCYTPAVAKIRELVHGGELGEIQYVDSVRINLGLVQRDIDVFWDLAPHDLSILEFILPEGREPLAVAAHGADPIGAGRSCVGYMTLPLRHGAIAHVHVNWLSPTKIRTTIIGGSKRTLVWDDLSPTQRISVYDRGVELSADALPSDMRREALISYRMGDMTAPALPESEALQNVVTEFATSIRENRAPITDGNAGLRVLRILEASSESLGWGGTLVPLGSWR